jgi:hypothetical protein
MLKAKVSAPLHIYVKEEEPYIEGRHRGDTARNSGGEMRKVVRL